MHINTSVVKALMSLRCVDAAELANLVHIPYADFSAWLYEDAPESEERVPFDTQLEVLRILGIHGEGPREDVVHYWRIHEPLFSTRSKNYWALDIALKAFGPAQAVFISRETDPFLTFKAKAHFGLKFEGFMAILEVTAHPLRNVSFDPTEMENLSWVPDTFGVLLPEADYARMEPGSMRVRNLTQYLTYSTEVAQWERLRETALENGIRAESVAALLLGQEGPVRISASPESRHSASEADDEFAQPVASVAPVEAATQAPAEPEVSTAVNSAEEPVAAKPEAYRDKTLITAPMLVRESSDEAERAQAPVDVAPDTAILQAAAAPAAPRKADDFALFTRPVQSIKRVNQKAA